MVGCVVYRNWRHILAKPDDDEFEKICLERPQDIHEEQLATVGADMDHQDVLDLLFDCDAFVDTIIARPGMPEYLLVDARYLSKMLKLYQSTLTIQ